MNTQTARIPRIIKYLLLFFGLLLLLLLLFVNSNLASLAEMLHPGAALWTHSGLLIVETLAIGWFWRGLFRGPKHLLLMHNDSPEAQQQFERELCRRMRSNPYIRQAEREGVFSHGADDSQYMESCLSLLKEKADKEIRHNARRVFLATALSQNGKLDALIVFVSLSRLIWRVSAIYNQRPHPSEIISLYWAVVSSTFLAFSIEELDVATEISVGFGETLHAMIPAGLTSSIPFAGTVLQTFTASTIDGATNCYLALRAGIITRNAYTYGSRLQDKPGRAAVFKEAGGQLMGMSQELIGRVAATIADCLTGAAKNAVFSAGGKTVQTGKDIVDGIGKVGQDFGNSASKIATGTVQGATKIATGTVDKIDKLASGVVDTATKVSHGAGKVFSGTAHAVRATRDSLASARSYTSKKLRAAKPASGRDSSAAHLEGLPSLEPDTEKENGKVETNTQAPPADDSAPSTKKTRKKRFFRR